MIVSYFCQLIQLETVMSFPIKLKSKENLQFSVHLYLEHRIFRQHFSSTQYNGPNIKKTIASFMHEKYFIEIILLKVYLSILRYQTINEIVRKEKHKKSSESVRLLRDYFRECICSNQSLWPFSTTFILILCATHSHQAIKISFILEAPWRKDINQLLCLLIHSNFSISE